jgi:putative flippase GtrA
MTASTPPPERVSWTARRKTARREGRLVLKHACVSCLGFAIDAGLLHLGVSNGLSPAWARVVSLGFAMQATFVINGWLVFRCLERDRLLRQWAGYMAATGLGNFCNYWIFLTLVSLHGRVVSIPIVALALGSVSAWMINYAAARLVVFRRRSAPLEAIIEDASCGEP